MDLTSQPSINDLRGRALNTVFGRMQQLALTPLLVYRIDSVPASALPFLAWQFDVASAFWELLVSGAGVPEIEGGDENKSVPEVDLITDVAALTSIAPLMEEGPGAPAVRASAALQRQLLKLAISLHRQRGTPWAIKTAVAALGWPEAQILEGQASWGGSSYPTSQGWAVCRVQIPLGAGLNVLGGAAAPVAAAFEFFKPARVWLDGVWFTMAPLADVLPGMIDLGISGELTNEISGDVMPRMAEALFAMVYPSPMSDAWSRTPVADGSYLGAGGLHGDGDSVNIVDDGIVVNGASWGVGVST